MIGTRLRPQGFLRLGNVADRPRDARLPKTGRPFRELAAHVTSGVRPLKRVIIGRGALYDERMKEERDAQA
ncbi:MAG: hypothetical protein AB7V13_30790 [Pseudorhodoplanes sp.]